jgi:hypothetical protein
MKNIIMIAGLIVVVLMSSCSFDTYSTHCPTYSHHNKARCEGANEVCEKKLTDVD